MWSREELVAEVNRLRSEQDKYAPHTEACYDLMAENKRLRGEMQDVELRLLDDDPKGALVHANRALRGDTTA
jgi:hypothetical protein